MAETLGQVIAREAAARAEANKQLGTLHKNAQKAGLFTGSLRTYKPFTETDEEARTGVKRQPPKEERVQLKAEELLKQFLAEMSVAVNLAHAKDTGNNMAAANVVVDGQVLLRDVPATHLLHMEKVLADLGTFVSALPLEDPTEEWIAGEDGLKRTAETFTVREMIKKVKLPLAPPTKEHAEQVAIIDETVPEGRWTTVKFSGALSPSRKRALERRVAALKDAFKVAREEANRLELPNARVDEGRILADYLLGE